MTHPQGPAGESTSYRGACRVCGTHHGLERTPDAAAVAQQLMARLLHDPRFERAGKMFGVLVGESSDGSAAELHAFSGMLDGEPFAHGFVGPTRSARLTAQAEAATLTALTELSTRIEALDVTGAERALATARHRFDHEIAALVSARNAQKRLREHEREALRASGEDTADRLAEMEAISQREGGRLRAIRRERREALTPLEETASDLRERRALLRRERGDRSRTLQAAMHASHGLLNFAGRYARLEEFFHAGIPTGAGECCAPKLLHEAALRGIRPTGVAEFWWGPPPASGGREHGRFYPPCAEKCGPILGHLLCGHEAPHAPLDILYEDDDLLAIDKPAGLLSVPGRTSASADCVETRLELLRPLEFLRSAHRLDQATSGVLVIARSREAHRQLSAAFASGRVAKRYRARVGGRVAKDSGEIRLPLRGPMETRPRQVIDVDSGRPASTRFVVVARGENTTDLLLEPHTGRTHQLRVHCADPAGLGTPIIGDALYGTAAPGQRLLLHANALRLAHPRTGAPLEITSPLPAELDQ
ncbi:MAG: RluA family pseudouridine synthase [Candidatus Binatia bacterium]|nr:RluA family pseudouridine synthase [Candidatus Binatia bacterium]